MPKRQWVSRVRYAQMMNERRSRQDMREHFDLHYDDKTENDPDKAKFINKLVNRLKRESTER